MDHGNLDVIGSIAPNMGKKLRKTKFPNENKTNDITNKHSTKIGILETHINIARYIR